MNKDIYIKGFRLVYENAMSLFDAAESLASNKEYPIANSLMILCAEEGLKGYMVLAQNFYQEGIIEGWEQSFQDHKYKLNVIRSIRFFSELFKKFDELYYYPIAQNILNQKEDHKEVKKKSLQNLLNWLKEIEKTNKSQITKESSWWNHAKTMKENGFYVGFNGVNWVVPKSIKNQHYSKTKEYVSEFLNTLHWLYAVDFDDDATKEWFYQVKNTFENYKKA